MREKLDEQQVAVARVYARALLQLARKNGEEQAVLEEFDAMVEQFERQPRFESILDDPALKEGERSELIERVLRDRANDLVVNTLQVMNRKGRVGMFRALLQAYREELIELGGIVEASATTAVPLTEATREKLLETLGRFTGKKVLLDEDVDESMLGGMILLIGDQKIDTSVSRELAGAGKRLEARAAEELQAAPSDQPGRRQYLDLEG